MHGGPNSATYKKPLIDFLGHAKLSYYTNRMAFQKVIAGSGDVDVVYGPNDQIKPVVINLGPERTINVLITINDMNGNEVLHTMYKDVHLPGGRTVTNLPAFTPDVPANASYAVEYTVTESP